MSAPEPPLVAPSVPPPGSGRGLFVIMLLALRCALADAQASATARPFLSASLAHYQVLDFTSHILETRRALKAAPDHGGPFVHSVHVLGTSVTMHLVPVQFPAGYRHDYVNADGSLHSSQGAPDCIYSGSVVGDAAARATVSLCEDFYHVRRALLVGCCEPRAS
jgi:hypothetical protein